MAVDRLRLDQPEDASPLIAELFRHWYAEHGLPTSRLLVSSFLLMDPMLTMRTGHVPYWALFGTRPSLDRLAGYLAGTPAYDDIALIVFPHGMDSIGVPAIGEWQQLIRHARTAGCSPLTRATTPGTSAPSPAFTMTEAAAPRTCPAPAFVGRGPALPGQPRRRPQRDV